MAVNPRSAPHWLTWAFAGSLVALFLGERVLGHLGWAHRLLTWGGVAAALASSAWRAASWAAADGDRRRVERMLLAAHLGCLVALALYLAGTDTGARWLHLGFASPARRARFQDALAVLWPIVLGASLLPALLAQWAHGASRHAPGGRPAVEAFRVAEAAAAGLTIAFAGALLLVAGYVAKERDRKVDLSYFRTAMPGSATRNMVASLGEPLKVVLFFPEVNEVKDEVLTYFDELAHATGRVEVESHDRMAAPALAKEYRVFRDGAVVLVRGEQHETINLDADIARARPTLRTLDAEVQKAFLKVARHARFAYLTVGHGELNDPGPEVTPETGGLTGSTAIKEILAALNYKVKDLGLAQGLAVDVPDDATIVLMLGPKKPLLPGELAALDRYLERGGALLVALSPQGEASLGPLEARLGVRFQPTPLADDKVYAALRHQPSDRRFIATGQFSSHASVTSLARSRAGSGILTPNSGSLVEVEGAAKGKGAPRRVFTVRSLASTFADANANDSFDEGEKRQSYNLAAAVEGPAPEKAAPPKTPETRAKKEKAKEQALVIKDEERHGMRALVYASADQFSDFVLMGSQLNLALLVDSVKWLGGEETFTGETRSEKDVPIQHTRSQDVAWFYSTIVGAPALVLVGGVAGVWRRRRRRGAAPRRAS